jgi:hypothetical protein
VGEAFKHAQRVLALATVQNLPVQRMSYNARPDSSPPQASIRGTASLHRRFLVTVGLGGAIAILVLGWGANIALNGVIARQGDVRVADAARRGLLVVDGALAERIRQAEFVVASPEVISAARAGAARARELGIVKAPIAE